MAVSLLEAAKLTEGNPLKSGIMETLAVSSELLNALPFETIQGSSIEYVQEKTLPTIGNRSVNEAYTEGTGETRRLQASLRIFGGKMQIDTANVAFHGEQQKAAQIAMKTKALAGYIERQLIKGDSVSNPETFDGLQNLVTTSSQIVSNGTAGLKLSKLDEAIDAVSDPSAIIMNKAMKRWLVAASRSTVGGNIQFSMDDFGRQITRYNGIPIISIGKDNAQAEILDFAEASSSTSVYVASFGPSMYSGIQHSRGLQVIDEGVTHPYHNIVIEWYIAQALWNDLAVARISGITNAAVTAS